MFRNFYHFELPKYTHVHNYIWNKHAQLLYSSFHTSVVDGKKTVVAVR